MRALVLLVASALGASCVAISNPAASDARPGEVQFELAGPGGAALVVPVTVNEQGPFPFVLDTGATLTCVDKRLVEELELREVKGIAAFGGGVRGLGSMQLVGIRSIEVGTARAADLRACVIDLQPMQKAGLDARGLLGLNFLKAYRLTIDFATQRVSFDSPADTKTTTR